jgi:hypothetical protein
MNPVLRWILVLPAAVGAYFLVQIANGFVTWMLPGFFNWPIQLFNSWAGPIALVVIAAKVAPAHKFIVAVAITITHAIILAILVTLECLSPNVSIPGWWLIVCALAGVAGTLVACVGISKDDSMVA